MNRKSSSPRGPMTSLARLDALCATEMRPIPGFHPYFASADGHIWNMENKWRSDGPRRLSSQIDQHGYPSVRVRVGKKYIAKKVHALVCMAFHGPRPSGGRIDTRHLNGIRTDNRAENLKWGTVRDNYLDRVAHGNNRMITDGSYNRSKTHCMRGHAFSQENTYRKTNGGRICKKCRALNYKRHYQTNKKTIIARQLERYHRLRAKGVPLDQ